MRAAVLLLLAGVLGCEPEADERVRAVAADHGCASCHTMSGVPGPHGVTGPPLTEMHRQAYVAGVLPMTPDNLARFIVDPQSVDPRSAMPNLGVTPEEAALLAAFLSDGGAR